MSIKSIWATLKTGFGEQVLIALAIFVFAVTLAILAYHFLPGLQEGYWPNVSIEFVGLIFDIAIFGLLLAFFAHRTNRMQDLQRQKQAIKHQQETIDDFKKWGSKEAKFRIAGAIRRINRLGKTDIDFGGIELHNFGFRRHDIMSIKGSVFYDGTWGELGSRDEVILEKVDFSRVDCRNVVFSKFNPFLGIFRDFAIFRDCDFHETKLAGATFRGAKLEWTAKPPEAIVEWHEDEDGHQFPEQTHYPPFWGTDLKGVSFVEVNFKNGDFRDANDILEADFTGAIGLETCVFDNDETRDEVIAMAQQDKRSE